MKKLTLVIDLFIDDNNLDRLRASRTPYLYTSESNSLYPIHINHLDYHHPNLAISYGRDNHLLINLEENQRQAFLINHQDLDRQFAVAMGVTDHLAMIAIGDTLHTRLQVVNVNQPLQVHLNTTYMEQHSNFFPLPRYFRGDSIETELVFSDASTLAIDLQAFTVGDRQEAELSKIIPPHTVLSPYLSVLGPFILLTITPEMSRERLYEFRLLVEQALQSSWIAIDETMVINTDLVTIKDYDEIINHRRKQMTKLKTIIDNYENSLAI